MAKTYAESGVDIGRGDSFVSFIRSMQSKAVGASSPIPSGGFAGGFELDLETYTHPVILSTTDGVGTKILVAQKLGVYDTIGIDLVAMCVNDLIVHGAKPVTFLDYIACGTIDRSVLEPVMEGVVSGCEIAGCTLSGGETAELPGMYEADAFDLAGFAIGIAERSELMPRNDWQPKGAHVYGLASTGIHSNGLSLARSVIGAEDSAYRMLLTPTRIYVQEVLALAKSHTIVAAAHITGGGLEGNISRVVPEGFRVKLTYDWPRPEVFGVIQSGGVTEEEMRKVFNLGIGMALIVPADLQSGFELAARENSIDIQRIGTIVVG